MLRAPITVFEDGLPLMFASAGDVEAYVDPAETGCVTVFDAGGRPLAFEGNPVRLAPAADPEGGGDLGSRLLAVIGSSRGDAAPSLDETLRRAWDHFGASRTRPGEWRIGAGAGPYPGG